MNEPICVAGMHIIRKLANAAYSANMTVWKFDHNYTQPVK